MVFILGIYCKKLTEHDKSKQINIRKPVQRNFFEVFEDKGIVRVKYRGTDTFNEICIHTSTDPRLGGKIKSIIKENTLDADLVVDDILAFYKYEGYFEFEIIKPNTPMYNYWNAQMNNESHFITEVWEEEVMVSAIENLPADINEASLPFNNPIPKEKRTVERHEIPRDQHVVAYILKHSDKLDFFEDIESSFGHPMPNTQKGKSLREVHHIIPLEYQSDFSVNLDVTMLCIPICIICHKILHDKNNGEIEFKKILVEYMYEQKKDVLANYLGITTYSDFAKYYNL